MSALPHPRPGPEAVDSFDQYIREAQKRLAEMHGDAQLQSSPEATALVEELVAALYSTIEELRGGKEELREQNEALVESQERLAAEHEHYRALFDLAPDAYLFTDEHGVIRAANHAASTLLALEPGDPGGKPLLVYVPEASRADFHALLTELRERGRIADARLLLQPRVGPPLPVAVTASAAFGDAGKGSIRWLMHDVTERLQAEENAQRLIREQSAREQAEATARRVAALAEASRILGSPVDVEHALRQMVHFLVPELADGCLLYLCEGAAALRRVAAAHSDPPTNRQLQRLIDLPPPDVDDASGPLACVLRTAQPQLIATIAGSEGGEPGLLEEQDEIRQLVAAHSLIAVPLRSADGILGAVCLTCSRAGRSFTTDDLNLAEDLARRITLAVENARLYAQAQHAADAREHLLNVVSHDLRNVLNAALLHTELLQLSVPSLAQDTPGGGSIATIHRTLEQMQRLVQDLLQAEQIEQGGLSLERSEQLIAPLVHQAIELQRPLAAERHLRLESQIPDDLPPVLADGGRVVQVLTNLLSNAIKFTPPAGHITIGALRRDGVVCISVVDTGPGIAAADLPHVFDSYWQSARTATHGAGLGLAIARGIVEGHGGRIWVESKPGMGSTFYFTIPVVHAER